MTELDSREAALTELDALLTLAQSAPLDAASCMQVRELCTLAPGRLRRSVATLARQRDAAAVDALLALPHGTRGVVEAVFNAVRHGVSRHDPEQGPCPRMMALEFRSSNSRSFPALLTRATAAFGSKLERIRVADKLHYRFALFEHMPALPSLSERAGPIELDLIRLHHDLARLRGVHLWLNGWRFDNQSPLRAPARGAVLQGWFEWAREQHEACPISPS